MKTRAVQFIVVASFLLGCRAVGRVEPARQFAVTVSGGSGNGLYPAASTVHVWADPGSPGQIFDCWVGADGLIANVRDRHVVFEMPARDVFLTATYAETPDWAATVETIASREVHHYFPRDPVGVSLLFHGSGGDAAEWLLSAGARRTFAEDAVAAGFAVVALESTDRVLNQWNLGEAPDLNPDRRAVESVLSTFSARQWVSDATARFGVGVSQGGRFLSLAASRLGLRAQAIHVGVGEAGFLKESKLPIVWCLGERDPIVDAREEILPTLHDLDDGGVDATMFVNAPAPLHPRSFTSIRGVNELQSSGVFWDLKSGGYLDDDHYLKDNPRLSGWERNVATGLSQPVRSEIRRALFVAYAEHEFYADCNRMVLDFFNSHR